MNHYGRKVVKTLLIGGTIATGLALNSSNSMAAELEETNTDVSAPEEEVQAPEEVAQAVEQVPEEVVVSEEGVQLMAEAPETDSTIQAMEDAVGVIEGDAVAEEGYLQQAEEAIADESLTAEQADEILENGKEVLDQAAEKKEQVEAAYEEAVAEYEAAKKDYYDVGWLENAKEMGMSDDEILAELDNYYKIEEEQRQKDVVDAEEMLAWANDNAESYKQQVQQEQEKLDSDQQYQKWLKDYEMYKQGYEDSEEDFRQAELALERLDEEWKETKKNNSLSEEEYKKAEKEYYEKRKALYEDLRAIAYDSHDMGIMIDIREDQIKGKEEKLRSLQLDLEEALSYVEDCETYKSSVEYDLNKIRSVVDRYNTAGQREIQAKALLEKANTEYKTVADTYDKLQSTITTYKEELANKPAEPEVTEETQTIEHTFEGNTEFNVVAKVNNEVKNIAVKIEHKITAKADVCVKTIKETATSAAKKTVSVVGQIAANITVSINNAKFSLAPIIKFALGFFGV